VKVSSLATVRRIKHLLDKEERMKPIVITLGKPMVEIEIPKSKDWQPVRVPEVLD
jgi:hypothetical protein